MTLFETFLLELAQVLQFPTLAPDAKGACLIIMKEGNVPLLFEFDDHLVPNTVLLSSLVCAIPIEKRADVYEASLIGNQSIEEALSVKPDEDLLYLHRRFHPSIQAADIEKLMARFLKSVQHWKGRVDQISKEPPRPGRLPPHPSAIQVFPYKA